MVEWRIATPADIEQAVREGMTEPTGIGEEGIRLMAVAGVDRSIDCRVYFVNGEMVCVVGIVAESIIAEECHLWAAFMPAALKFPKTIARHTRAYVEGLPYIRMTCLCDPAFVKTLLWVRWMGFTYVQDHVIMDKNYALFERRA